LGVERVLLGITIEIKIMKMKHILVRLEAMGFRIITNDGSRKKIFPSNKNLPFYSLHSDLKDNPAAFMALNKFSKRNWNLDLTRI